MKQLLKPTNLPGATAAAGILGLLLQRTLYAVALDETNLLPRNHPLQLLLAVYSLAVLGSIVLAAWKLDGSNKYRNNFSPSFPAAAGNVLMAAGVALTVLLNDPRMPGALGLAWKLFGWVSAPCLLAAGFARVQGKRPFFLLHLIPCLFLVFHIVTHYQTWCGNPQLQDYLFTLFGTMALMFFAYYHAAFEAGSGKRRMHMGMGLAGAYLCIVNLAFTEYLFLYVGGIAWMLTDLCTMTPKPKSAPKKEEGGEAK